MKYTLTFLDRCAHCQTMAPHYINAAAELKANGINAVMAEMDATIHKKTAQKFVLVIYAIV